MGAAEDEHLPTRPDAHGTGARGNRRLRQPAPASGSAAGSAAGSPAARERYGRRCPDREHYREDDPEPARVRPAAENRPNDAHAVSPRSGSCSEGRPASGALRNPLRQSRRGSRSGWRLLDGDRYCGSAGAVSKAACSSSGIAYVCCSSGKAPLRTSSA